MLHQLSFGGVVDCGLVDSSSIVTKTKGGERRTNNWEGSGDV